MRRPGTLEGGIEIHARNDGRNLSRQVAQVVRVRSRWLHWLRHREEAEAGLGMLDLHAAVVPDLLPGEPVVPPARECARRSSCSCPSARGLPADAGQNSAESLRPVGGPSGRGPSPAR